ELDGATMLDFGIEKEEYKVGEKIALSIPSTPGNRILVSLESGSEVLQTFWVEAEKENTAISFEATSEMSPNVYAHLTMVQPHGQSSNDLPIRLYGVQSIKVVDPSTELKPVIGMPKELQPEQRYTIEISEANKKAMAYTLAVVDEGLLDITNFETPSPWSAFFAREALGIKTWDVYDDVMGAFSGKMEPLLAIGGDGEIGEKEEKEANRFKPVVHYLGPFYLSAGKTAKHILTMPQYIGSVKTMVVAAGNGAYGKADQQTPVKQPLMVMATLPRVAGPGESMKLPVNVFVLDKKIKNISLKVESKGTLVLQGSPTMTLTFNGEGDQVAYFDLKAKEALGMGKVTVTATSGQLSATYDVEMNVIPRNPQVTKLQDKIIAEGSQWETRYQPTGILGKNKAFVEFSSLPPLNIEQRLGYLIQYPHGCIEQTTSAVFAQLFINKLMKLDSDRESEIQQNVAAAIKRLKSFQLPSGGFSYWPGNDYPNLWGTNYAGHFLIEAKASGYDVPESLLSSWIGFQTQKAESWNVQNSDQDNDLTQAYRLYTLAKVGNPALGAMNRMKERPNLKREASWRLALAYAIAGYDTQARELIEGLVTEPDAANIHYRSTFGSQTRDQAMILETLLTLDQKEKAFGILMKIAGEMGEKDRWMSTQTTAYCFIAIAKYTDKFKVDEETNIALDFGGKTSSLKGNDFVYQASLPDPDKPVSIKISNKGNAPVFARLIQTGIPIEGTGQSEAENIRFEISYYDKDGSSLDISRLPQGTNFTAKVTVSNPGLKGPYTELALTQIFPSGWEIINTRLDGSDQVMEASVAKYMDIRDDRVMHYFDLAPNKQASFTVMLNAAYQGSYFLPTVSVEAMYDNTIYARKAGKWVQVVAE
ncbi:MAG: hypothetical protein OEY56_08135, partial [Cyclobacteriaceae bacterium]|nr:hypothetical protein [Cyclobacteriaceae bacterium]